MSPDREKLLAATYDGFERVDLTMRDGSKLAAYERGPVGAPAVVIVNPIGVPIVIASRLARRCAERYRVVCWEQRGFRADPREFFEKPHDYATYISDLLEVVAQRAAAPCILVGVCSGAALVIKAIATKLLEASRLVLVSPAVHFKEGYAPSVFDQAFVPYMRMISSGRRQLAKEILDMRAARLAEQQAPPSLDEQIAEAADTASLDSVDSLTVYARSVQIFTDQRLDAEIAQVPQKAHVFSAADDRTVSIRTVRELCRRLPNSELREYKTGGHYMAFLRDDVQEAIYEAISSP
jgi:pimeloyl-ACP methyl ester carboxylesterase